MTGRRSTAAREGYKILGDQEILNGVEGRARQLEAELAGNRLFRDEAEALGDDAAVSVHTEAIAQLEARLKVVHERREALKANMPKASDKGASSAATAT